RKDDVVRIASIFDLREEYTVRVSGAVNQPRTLQYRDSMTVEDAVFMADGFLDEAAAYRIEVARRVVGTGEPDQYKIDEIAEIFSFHVDEHLGFREDEGDFRLQPFDQVYIRTQPNYQEQQTVRITGEVEYPGEYVLSSRDARLSDLIDWAGGLSEYAYSRGASLERILEISQRPEITEIDDEMAGVGDDEQREQGEVVDTLTTPVGIQLANALSNPRSGYDLILEEGDEIHIPRELQIVRVEGEVLSPTSVRYDPNRSFSDYLSAAGGVTEEARRRRAYVVYANGEVDRTKRFLFIRNNPTIEPGATIIVPREPERRQMTAQERVGIASSIASTALLFITLLERLN
ncbi:MAG: SLBB domain-containing protein, partial [Balneolaceae bacterium]